MSYSEIRKVVSCLEKNLVIMAGGAGTRFGGNKQLAPIGPSGELLLEYSVYDAILAGFRRIICVVRPGMEEKFREILTPYSEAYTDISFICAVQSFDDIPGFSAFHPERTKPLGTVHALLSAAKYISGPFAVINADDYYGRGAIRQIAMAIDAFVSPSDAAMVLYELRNTLSLHGAVTRGICEIESGILVSIREAFNISVKGTDAVEIIDGRESFLPGSYPVSMNMWAFPRDILPFVSEYFHLFLDNLQADDMRSECLLPDMTESFIRRSMLRVMTYPTDCKWFGLTYRNDAADAAWELDKRHTDGSYPAKLI